ncbi:iron (Fe) ABC superfamily ATP binding cassette transporter, binding protein [Desmospora sp. 8437]|nr:iron (Fe) ABC superfamily ATP binding cassette transporter, binding protein [Desmospora sp. 8437]
MASGVFLFASEKTVNGSGEKMKRWTRISAIWLSLLLVFAVVGCASTPNAGDSTPAVGDSGKQEAGFPVTLTDGTHTKVTVKKEPKRIISLIPSMTETAYALGLGERMVGVTTNDDYPAEVKKVEKVGDMNIDTEKVLSLKPDLVLASEGLNGKETVDKLRKLGLTVIAYEPEDLNGVFQQIQDVGKATGAGKEADRLIGKMKKEKQLAEKIAAKVPADKQAKVWIEVSSDLYTAGDETFMNELITLAGGKNVATGEKGWFQASSENVVKWNPDVILYTHPDKKEKITSRGGWKSIRAVKEGRVEQLETNIVSRPGPRITEGLLLISKAIYPEIYAETAK